MFSLRNRCLTGVAAFALCLALPPSRADASIPSALSHPQVAQAAASVPVSVAPAYVLLYVAPDGSFQVDFCRNDPVNVTDPTGLKAKLILEQGWHMKLAVERRDATDDKTWILYDFAAQPGQGVGVDMDPWGQERPLNEGVPGKVECRFVTDTEISDLVAKNPVAYQVITTEEQDLAMEKEILRQFHARVKPAYKMTTSPWNPKADEGVCIQRPIQIINGATGFQLPLLWLEGGMAMFLMDQAPCNTYPIIEALDRRAENVNETRFTIVREKPQQLDKTSTRFKKTMEGYDYFNNVTKRGKNLSQAVQYWSDHKKFLPIEKLRDDK
jgi:hypothetical protein